MTKQTTMIPTIRDGELEHVVVVAGQKVQSHSSLPAALCALALAMALSGCTFCREHETTCEVVGFVTAASIALSVGPHGNSHSGTDYTVSSPLTYPGIKPVNCTTGECK